METSKVSKYTIKMNDDSRGFKVIGRGHEVSIYLDGPKFCINESYHSVGLFEFHRLLDYIGRSLMSDWEPPPEKKKKSRVVHSKLQAWAITQTKKALAKRVQNFWKTVLNSADPNMVNVHRKVFAATGRCNETIKLKEFYSEANNYLIKDILNYRAAALATEHIQQDINYIWPTKDGEPKPQFSFNPDWMKLYANNEDVYPTLRRMLTSDRFPGGIPAWQVPNFQLFHFERPIFDRLELLTLLSARWTSPNLHIFMHAKRKDIQRAIHRVAEHRRETPRTRKSNYIADVVRFIDDYPERHNGNICGLADRSIRWHALGNATAVQYSAKYSANKQTALPPVPLPTAEGIVFLDTVGKVWEEGQRMSHCVGRSGYADLAVEGQSYLFHIDHAGDMATAEISSNGRIMQVNGVKNKNLNNKAVTYGKRKLTKWVKLFQLEYSNVGETQEDLPF